MALCLILTAFPAHSKETVKIALGDWEPFTSSRADNSNISEELVREAFKYQNIEVEYQYFPWIRSYKYVEKGEFQATFPWVITEDRKKEVFFSKEPLLTERTVFFHLKSRPFHWETFDDLKGLKIGGTLGYATGKILENNGLILDYVSKEDFNYHKLLKKRLDVFPTSFFVGYHQINMLFQANEAKLFTHHPKVLEEKNYYMVFSKNIPNAHQLIKSFDEGLIKLKESGRYNQIILKASQPSL
jgi:polar amino acid transport system substrate-binding protein